jgi:hypothetical protein
MTFEPTFDDLEQRSASLPDVSGPTSDPDPDEVDRDLAGDSAIDGDAGAIDGDDVDEAEESGIGAALGGDVEADDLPPLGA